MSFSFLIMLPIIEMRGLYFKNKEKLFKKEVCNKLLNY